MKRTIRARVTTKIMAGAVGGAVIVALLASRGVVSAQSDNTCSGLPTQTELKTALVTARGAANGGFNLDMWGSIVNRDGVVCAVAFTGADRGSQWPGSRVISAQKANTANSFSLPGLALSSAKIAGVDGVSAISAALPVTQ